MTGVRRRGVVRMPWSGFVVALAVLVVAASIAGTWVNGLAQPDLACAFGAFIAFGELLRIALPGDRDAAPLGMAASIAYALLGDVHGVRTLYGVGQVAAVTAVGMALGLLPHRLADRDPRLDDAARRILTVTAAAAMYRPAYLTGQLSGLSGHPVYLVLFLLAVVIVASLLDGLLAALSRTAGGGWRLGTAFCDEAAALLAITMAAGVTGLLIALVSGMMSVWAIPAFCLPLLLAQLAFRRYADVRSTYLQTIQSLSRVTEVAGYTEEGHSRRVSQLALAVGRDLAMPERELLDLQYAALMHDIGQLSLTDPIPGGATVLAAADDQRRIARRGGEVIRQTGVLDTVAMLVERQAEPCRWPDGSQNPLVPLGSRIIRVVNAYDDLVGGTVPTVHPRGALERLRVGAEREHEYDLRVVEALSRVVSGPWHEARGA